MQGPTSTVNRITAAGIGGAITVVIVWVMQIGWELKPPGEVTVALTTIVTAITQAIYSRFAGFQGPGKNQTGNGYAHPAVLLLVGVIMAVALSACSNLVREPETVYERLFVANRYGEQVTQTVNDMRRAGVIDTSRHQEALDYLQEALNASRAGRVAYEAGNWNSAESRLDRTEAALTAVAVLLAPHLPETPQNEAFVTRYGGAR